jgi:hypothetical protein
MTAKIRETKGTAAFIPPEAVDSLIIELLNYYYYLFISYLII